MLDPSRLSETSRIWAVYQIYFSFKLTPTSYSRRMGGNPISGRMFNCSLFFNEDFTETLRLKLDYITPNLFYS
jgi:hypothetical protein